MKPTAGGLFGDFERDMSYWPSNRTINKVKIRPYETQSGIYPEEKIISCATCGICKDNRPCKFLDGCLLSECDEPKTYHSWPRFRDDFNYLNWEPLNPIKTEHLEKELFEI